jgi:hypothetical protein
MWPSARKGMKESKQLAQRRKGAKIRKDEVLSLPYDLSVPCDFA